MPASPVLAQRSVDMDTNFMDTGVYVHVTNMVMDMDMRFLKTRDTDMDMDKRFLKNRDTDMDMNFSVMDMDHVTWS